MNSVDFEGSALSRSELEARRAHQQRLSFDEKDFNQDSMSTGDELLQRRLVLAIAGSGSKGNSSFVFDRVSAEGILIDAGICKRDVLAASKQAGFDPIGLRGIFISHSHSDHVKNLGVILRWLDSESIQVPLYMHSRTLAASKELELVAQTHEVIFIEAGSKVEFGTISVTVLPTSHDTEVSFGFRVDAGGDALGYITDTGVLLPETFRALSGVRILGLESNHDVSMLRNGPYPRALQERVRSDTGHLSNEQAANVLSGLLASDGAARLESVVALHISENNNTYRMPVETLRDVARKAGSDVQVTCAYQKRATFVS